LCSLSARDKGVYRHLCTKILTPGHTSHIDGRGPKIIYVASVVPGDSTVNVFHHLDAYLSAACPRPSLVPKIFFWQNGHCSIFVVI
jgi:hypothetical protein